MLPGVLHADPQRRDARWMTSGDELNAEHQLESYWAEDELARQAEDESDVDEEDTVGTDEEEPVEDAERLEAVDEEPEGGEAPAGT